METWFYNPASDDFWCAISLPVDIPVYAVDEQGEEQLQGYKSGLEQLLASYPEGTIQIPAPPEGDYAFDGTKWIALPPAPEPTLEERRANMLPLSARQFRLGLLEGGVSLSSIDAAIAAIPDPLERDKAQVAWEYAVEFQRLNPLVLTLSAAIGLLPEDVDDLWEIARSL